MRLNQVLINLLGNAVKFTPEKGSVQVSVYQEALPEDTFCVRTHFLVSDTGIGMSQEYQKVIFDSFSREDDTRVQKTEGSGPFRVILPLSILEMSSTSLISPSRCLLDRAIVLPFDNLDQTILGMSSRWLTIVYAASFAAIAMRCPARR